VVLQIKSHEKLRLLARVFMTSHSKKAKASGTDRKNYLFNNPDQHKLSSFGGTRAFLISFCRLFRNYISCT
jgi:hypothetical protein